ncbi:hypothetical protein BCD_0855 (plasmid) [Borrelia crocidurae DOU]|uniref:Uncharacterized protein n=1 Tax=Borrelia crocidurae DOU TaxID=1293575 RepID=W5SPB1_9SPIR|nr:hypothetical protein BCD_0855 [Borrelia crocidurae DOU]
MPKTSSGKMDNKFIELDNKFKINKTELSGKFNIE